MYANLPYVDALLSKFSMKLTSVVLCCVVIFQAVWSVSVLPDGRVISGSRDCTARVWKLETGECLRVFECHTECEVSIFFSD